MRLPLCNRYDCKHIDDVTARCTIEIGIVNGVCVNYRRVYKPKQDYEKMMQASEPKGYKRNGKWVHN